MKKQVFKTFFVFSALFSACLNAWAEGYNAGHGNITTKPTATAVGHNNLASMDTSSAVGFQNAASGRASSAFGYNNVAIEYMSSAFGFQNTASGEHSSAFGSLNKVYAEGATAIGHFNTIGSFIEGDNPDYPELNTYVLGSHVTTSVRNAVVLGHNSRDGGDNTVSVGAANNLRKIVFVNDGDISSTSKDAINGSQLNNVLQNATGINVANWKTALGITAVEGGGNSELTNSISQYFGGGSSANGTGGLTAPTYTITNISENTSTTSNYNNVGAALTALDNNTKALNTSISNKANKNADNLTDADVSGWQQKLGNGKVEAGDKGLVTGNTVNEVIVVINKRIDEVATNSGGSSSHVIDYLGGEATATEAPTYTITDVTTGQNVDYRNVGDALKQLNVNQNIITDNVINLSKDQKQLRKTVSQNRKEAQAGVAAAVAIASLPTSNEPGQTVFSVAGGSFKGQSAMAMGLSKRTENGKFLIKANASMNTRGDTAVGAGFGFVW